MSESENGSTSYVVRRGYKRAAGQMWLGLAERLLTSQRFDQHRAKVQLILTSPPFPLNRKKEYGNLQGEAFSSWLASFAPLFRDMLTPHGSIVIEMGNAWEPSRPVMSTLTMRSLLAFLEAGELQLCQQFANFNPARLPSPVQWVNVERIRVKDAFTHVWWMARHDRPYADNRAVLQPYGPDMLRLLKNGSYNGGRRPSEHLIGAASFLANNGGAIPPNVLVHTNTTSNDEYHRYCRDRGLRPHPARMSSGVAEFFIRMLTKPGDLVLDPFAGSNTTGAAAESLGRRWVSIEANPLYVEGSRGRFLSRDALQRA